MRKFLLYCILAVLVIVGVMVYNSTSHITVPATQTTGPTPLQPAQLRIPSIRVNASVMSVGRTSQGVMDAPVSKAVNSPYWTHVFWYNPGAIPGQQGNAVIAGHVDRVGGDPAIFWSLKDLTVGNDVFVTTMQGKALHFVVSRVKAYPATATSSDDMSAIFGPSTDHNLNLITCSGVWTGHGYDQRLVVFTTLVS